MNTSMAVGQSMNKCPEYAHNEFHYDLRMCIGGRRLYFETVLKVVKDASDPDDPIIIVVNVHDA
jgi:hypothetical protein